MPAAGRIAVDPNDVEEKLEELAEREIETASPQFKTWLVEEAEPRLVAAFIACAVKSLRTLRDQSVARGQALDSYDKLRHDYVAHRRVTGENDGTLDDIRAELARGYGADSDD